MKALNIRTSNLVPGQIWFIHEEPEATKRFLDNLCGNKGREHTAKCRPWLITSVNEYNVYAVPLSTSETHMRYTIEATIDGLTQYILCDREERFDKSRFDHSLSYMERCLHYDDLALIESVIFSCRFKKDFSENNMQDIIKAAYEYDEPTMPIVEADVYKDQYYRNCTIIPKEMFGEPEVEIKPATNTEKPRVYSRKKSDEEKLLNKHHKIFLKSFEVTYKIDALKAISISDIVSICKKQSGILTLTEETMTSMISSFYDELYWKKEGVMVGIIKIVVEDNRKHKKVNKVQRVISPVESRPESIAARVYGLSFHYCRSTGDNIDVDKRIAAAYLYIKHNISIDVISDVMSTTKYNISSVVSRYSRNAEIVNIINNISLGDAIIAPYEYLIK